MAHTPGPWYCHFATAVAEVAEDDWNDATGITTVSEEDFVRSGERGDLVALVPHDRNHAANASLIAAAPELLAALRDVADGCERRLRKGKDHGDLDTLRVCRSAIAKAEGRE